MKKMIFILVWPFLLLHACASQAPYIDIPISATQGNRISLDACKVFYKSLDTAIEKAGVRDAQWHIVKSYPFLRTNRFLASFRYIPMSQRRFNAWIDRMQTLDQTARYIEIQNLAGTMQLQHIGKRGDTAELFETTLRCNKMLRQALPDDPETVRNVRRNTLVPDNYQAWKRWLGLYPLTSQLVKVGIRKYHEETRQKFSTPLNRLESYGLLVNYHPGNGITRLTFAELARILTRATANPLSIPELSKQQQQLFFYQFAPILEIDVSGPHDNIGTVRLNRDGKPTIDISQPMVYTYQSFTHFRGNTLLQLNYTFWFPRRPATHKLDILSGFLDGITWRVTLAPSGKPVLYDAVHNCGCYHMFFPAQNFVRKLEASSLPEPPLVPQRAPNIAAHQRMVIRIGSQKHDIQRIYAVKRHGKSHGYALTDYATLRSLSTGGVKRQSLFSANGLVRGTQRSERFVLWPMGIISAGAMRQQGHHAVAFRGRRHFDDANLVERLFMAK